MNIVFVCSEYPIAGRPTGGFGSYVNNITNIIIKDNNRVTVLCRGQRSQSFLSHGKKVIVIDSKLNLIRSMSAFLLKVNFLNKILSFVEYPLYYSFLVYKKIRIMQQFEQIDLIEGGDFGGELFFHLLLKSRSTVRNIIKLHTPSYLIRQFNDEPNNVFYKVMNFIESYCLIHVDYLYSPSKALAKLVSIKKKVKTAAIIPYPFEKGLSNVSIKKVKKNNNLILYVGKIQKKKGVYDIIDAFSLAVESNPLIELILVGPDTKINGLSSRMELEECITKKGIKNHVSFIGEVNQMILSRYYRKAIAVLVPSHWENFPNVILEAVKYHCLVIATKVGGISEMIEDGQSGLLVDVGNVKQLAMSVLKAVSNKELRINLTKNAKSMFMKRYSPINIGKLTTDFYDKCLAN